MILVTCRKGLFGKMTRRSDGTIIGGRGHDPKVIVLVGTRVEWVPRLVGGKVLLTKLESEFWIARTKGTLTEIRFGPLK